MRFGLMLWTPISRALDWQPRSRALFPPTALGMSLLASPNVCPGDCFSKGELFSKEELFGPEKPVVKLQSVLKSWSFDTFLMEEKTRKVWWPKSINSEHSSVYVKSQACNFRQFSFRLNWWSYRQSPMSAKARAERRMLFFQESTFSNTPEM